MTSVIGWLLLDGEHILPTGERLSPAMILPEGGRVTPGVSGFGAYTTALDALRSAQGPWLCQVRLEGSLHPGKYVGDVWASRQILLADPVDCSRFLREFACDCIERALPIYEEQCPHDNRVRQVIEVARKFATGAATPEDLAAAAIGAMRIVIDINEATRRDSNIDSEIQDIDNSRHVAEAAAAVTLVPAQLAARAASGHILEASADKAGRPGSGVELQWQERTLVKYFEASLRCTAIAKLEELDIWLG